MKQTSWQYITASDLERLLKDDESATLIDARTREEFGREHVPRAINVPITELAGFARGRGNTAKGLVVTMCGSTGRGEQTAVILAALGEERVLVMQGGLKAWKEDGFPVT
jgi:rhodanese-related sulfurtransferase